MLLAVKDEILHYHQFSSIKQAVEQQKANKLALQTTIIKYTIVLLVPSTCLYITGQLKVKITQGKSREEEKLNNYSENCLT